MQPINILSDLIGHEKVSIDKETIENFGKDWTNYYSINSPAVVFPKTTEDVQKIINWANTHKISIVPSGGRTGLSGAACATNGEVVLSLDRMNRIHSYDPIDQTIHCQAGVITETIQNFAKENGAYFPVDFAARGSSQIGGNIATNAGGIKVIRYGLMRDWVAGMTVVTGAGQVLHLNNSLVKNATGFDLRHLIAGSEGTLAVITEVSLKVTRPPLPQKVMVLGLTELPSIMKVYQEFTKNLSVTAFELFTDLALKHVLAAGSAPAPFETRTPYYLLIEFEETGEQSEEVALGVFEKCVESEYVVDGVLDQNETQAKDLWKLREDITEATIQYKPYKNDVSVPISKVPEFIEKVDSLLTASYPQFEVVWFGHIGDGNLHINILKPNDLEMSDFLTECKKVDALLFAAIKDFGGSVSAEHGVGLSKKPFLNFTRSEEEISLMRAIKKCFDPNWILNPGKVFDQ